MMGEQMIQALNKQLNAEMYSAYLYLSMSAWFESQNLPGMAKWMRVQAGEEQGHAMKFFDYVVSRNAKIALAEIDAPPAKWTSPLGVFENALKHEQKVTGMINDLAAQAEKEKDRATINFLQWFITEQVEEEANATKIVETLKMVKDSAGGLLQIDHQLGKRE